jgi:hypothetical protein
MQSRYHRAPSPNATGILFSDFAQAVGLHAISASKCAQSHETSVKYLTNRRPSQQCVRPALRRLQIRGRSDYVGLAPHCGPDGTICASIRVCLPLPAALSRKTEITIGATRNATQLLTPPDLCEVGQRGGRSFLREPRSGAKARRVADGREDPRWLDRAGEQRESLSALGIMDPRAVGTPACTEFTIPHTLARAGSPVRRLVVLYWS